METRDSEDFRRQNSNNTDGSNKRQRTTSSNDSYKEDAYTRVGDNVGRNNFDKTKKIKRNEIIECVGGTLNGWKNRVVHSVIAQEECTQSKRYVFNELVRTLEKHQFGLVAWHPRNVDSQGAACVNGSHWHFYHDCSWRNSTCRCIQFAVRPRCDKQHVTNTIGTTLYVDAQIQYHEKTPREIKYIKVGQKRWSVSRSNESLEYERSDRCTIHESFREDCSKCKLCVRCDRSIMGTSNQLVTQFGEEIKRGGGEGVCSRSESTTSVLDALNCNQNKKGSTANILTTFFLSYPTYPVSALINTPIWLKSEHRFLLAKDKCVCRALQYIQTYIESLSVKQLEELFSKIPYENQIFGARSDNVKDYYFSIEESVEAIETILLYQLDNDNESVNIFINNVYEIVDKKRPKKNTLYIVGSPSSGKNFIFDSLAAFCLNVGHIGNFTRSNQFPFNDCKSRRLLIWNEPNFMPSAIDTMKMILGGDPCAVNIKFEAHYTLPRTPIIMLSNRDVLSINGNESLYFRERCFTYNNWKTLFGEKPSKKPHPLVWPVLFKKHVIDY